MTDHFHFVNVPRQDPSKLAPEVCVTRFEDIYASFGRNDAAVQSERCLGCGNPYCEWKCPVHNYIPNWLQLVAEGRIVEAAELFFP